MKTIAVMVVLFILSISGSHAYADERGRQSGGFMDAIGRAVTTTLVYAAPGAVLGGMATQSWEGAGKGAAVAGVLGYMNRGRARGGYRSGYGAGHSGYGYSNYGSGGHGGGDYYSGGGNPGIDAAIESGRAAQHRDTSYQLRRVEQHQKQDAYNSGRYGSYNH